MRLDGYVTWAMLNALRLPFFPLLATAIPDFDQDVRTALLPGHLVCNALLQCWLVIAPQCWLTNKYFSTKTLPKQS